jgi:hypothetical protein
VLHAKKVWRKVREGTLTEPTLEELAAGIATDEAEVYQRHGNYKVVKNDLCYTDDEKQPQTGLSILHFGYLLGYIARDKLIEKKYMDAWVADPNDPY